MNNEILTNLVDSINSFVLDYRNDLYGYLYEYHVQSALFAKLRKDIDRYFDVDGISEEKTYKLNLIYSEYLDSFDLCCLNLEEIKVIKESPIYTHNKGHDDFIYQLPVLLAIELKFIPGNRTGNFFGVIDDERKIKNSKFRDRIKNWLCICFIQNQHIAQKHIKNKPLGLKVSEVEKIETLNTSYVISPENTYLISNI